MHEPCYFPDALLAKHRLLFIDFATPQLPVVDQHTRATHKQYCTRFTRTGRPRGLSHESSRPGPGIFPQKSFIAALSRRSSLSL